MGKNYAKNNVRAVYANTYLCVVETRCVNTIPITKGKYKK